MYHKSSISYIRMSKPTPIVLSVNDWNPSAIRYTPPRVNDRGAKSINITSTQTGRWLHVSTPLMMTWGVSDFVDEKGESDGKYKISLVFPGEEEANKSTNEFLEKVKAFENQILEDAVKYSELWFGEEMSREVANHTFFRSLKYPKDKTTKKYDYTKPPTVRASVPVYDNRWAVEVYDTKNSLLFPNKDKPELTPLDFIPRKSKVASVIQCSGLWFGGKGWGVTWKLTQCVVKPQENLTVFGRCHIQLSNDDLETIDSQPVTASVADDDDEEMAAVSSSAQVTSTEVEDSDEEEEDDSEPVTQVPVKKVIKKAPAVAAVTDAAVEAAPEPVKKKIVKKKV